MKHLEYKDTNNKAFKTYYDKFKKMVKQDLSGDGWFLLVKDFPFKDGDNLMFTAGEDIGKWQDKNLVSLYGKTKYIVGRCRKKGPVISLLDFQEGDYVKEATEAGLRKELKEFFKGTGVSVRTFKSLKVNEPDPELAEEDAPDPEEGEEVATQTETTGFEALEMPKLSPTAIKALLEKAIAYAQKMGVIDEQEFVDRVNAFKKAVPNMGRMKGALGQLNEYLERLKSPTEGGAEASGRQEELIRLMEAEKQKIIKKLQELVGLAEEDYDGTLEEQKALYEEAKSSYQTLTQTYAEELRSLQV